MRPLWPVLVILPDLSRDRPRNVLATRAYLSDEGRFRRPDRHGERCLPGADERLPELPRVRGGMPKRCAVRPDSGGVAHPDRAGPRRWPAAAASLGGQADPRRRVWRDVQATGTISPVFAIDVAVSAQWRPGDRAAQRHAQAAQARRNRDAA